MPNYDFQHSTAYKPNLKAFEIDWYDIAMENDFRRKMAKDD